MNSTPARLKTRLITARVSGSPTYRPTSILVMVLRWSPVAAAKSRTVQLRAALAILTCALVTGCLLCYCHMCSEHSIQYSLGAADVEIFKTWRSPHVRRRLRRPDHHGQR